MFHVHLPSTSISTHHNKKQEKLALHWPGRLMDSSTLLQISKIAEICFVVAVVIFFIQTIRIFSTFSLKDLELWAVPSFGRSKNKNNNIMASGCQICATTGQCSLAFRGGPGQYCGQWYDRSTSTNKPCCCPLLQVGMPSTCRISPIECKCHVYGSNQGYNPSQYRGTTNQQNYDIKETISCGSINVDTISFLLLFVLLLS